MEKAQIALLKQFVDICQAKPQVLHRPELAFFKEWLESLGATLPSEPETSSEDKPQSPPPSQPKMATPVEESEESEESVESDLDIDLEGVIQDNEVPAQEMGDSSVEVSDEQLEAADEKRSQALSAFSEGNFEEAIAAFTEVIKINPSAPMFAKRAHCFLKLKRARAAIKDCDRALELNPDSALAYKIRGMSHKLVGEWEKAFADLTTSNKIDFSEDAHSAMKEVEAKAKRILEHKRKYERKAEEKKIRQRLRRVKKAREAYEKAKKEESTSSGFGINPEDMATDPDLINMMQDPEVMQALNEIMTDPSKAAKHMANPKIRTVMEKMQSKFFQGGFSNIFGGHGGSDDCCGGDSSCHGHSHGGADAGDSSHGVPPSADDLD